jgi:hypothetical protein
MTIKKTLILIGLSIGILVILSYSLLVGYSDYRKYTFNNTFLSCSFEYPRFHRVISIEQPNKNSPIARVFIALIQLKSPQDESINISIREADSLFPGYNALLEFQQNTLRNSLVNSDLKILETSNTMVDGITSEKIKYFYFRPDEPKGNGDQLKVPNATPTYSFNVYFEKNGFIWEIKVVAIATRVKQAEADFDHILETFKILE